MDTSKKTRRRGKLALRGRAKEEEMDGKEATKQQELQRKIDRKSWRGRNRLG